MPFYKKLFHKPVKYLAEQYRLSREAEEKVAKKFKGILPMPEIGGIRMVRGKQVITKFPQKWEEIRGMVRKGYDKGFIGKRFKITTEEINRILREMWSIKY